MLAKKDDSNLKDYGKSVHGDRDDNDRWMHDHLRLHMIRNEVIIDKKGVTPIEDKNHKINRRVFDDIELKCIKRRVQMHQ